MITEFQASDTVILQPSTISRHFDQSGNKREGNNNRPKRQRGMHRIVCRGTGFSARPTCCYRVIWRQWGEAFSPPPPPRLTFPWWVWGCYKMPTLVYSVLASISVFMALSIVFHFINSSDNSLLSHSDLPVLSLPYWSLQLYVSLVYESLLIQPWYNPKRLTGLKASIN